MRMEITIIPWNDGNTTMQKFPNIWLLAQHILSIPAISAPSEKVFIAASNITDKTRAHITTRQF
jgi:hypothetical protein